MPFLHSGKKYLRMVGHFIDDAVRRGARYIKQEVGSGLILEVFDSDSVIHKHTVGMGMV